MVGHLEYFKLEMIFDELIKTKSVAVTA